MERIDYMKIIIALMIACLTLTPCFSAAEEFDHGEYYPLLTVAVEVETLEDCLVVTCLDKMGNLWVFYDADCICECDDVYILMMHDVNNTPDNFEDDIILDIYWECFLTNLGDFFKDAQSKLDV